MGSWVISTNQAIYLGPVEPTSQVQYGFVTLCAQAMEEVSHYSPRYGAWLLISGCADLCFQFPGVGQDSGCHRYVWI